MSSTEDDRFDRALRLIVATAKAALPEEPRKAIELMLLAAFSYCKHELKMTTKDACDSLDMCLSALFEQLGA